MLQTVDLVKLGPNRPRQLGGRRGAMGPATSQGRTDLKNFGPAGSETGCSWFGDGCEGLRVQVAAEDAGWDGGIWPRQLVVSLRRQPGRGEGRGADPTRKSRLLTLMLS